MGKRALFSYKALFDATGYPNCQTEERSEAVQFEDEIASSRAL